MFAQFISEYGTQILFAIVTAIAGYIGLVVKNIYQKYINDKMKENIVKNAVKFVEQVYKDLHGEEKLNEALVAAAEMLNEKGIAVTGLELRVLVEAAVAEFNGAFNNIIEKEEVANDREGN